MRRALIQSNIEYRLTRWLDNKVLAVNSTNIEYRLTRWLDNKVLAVNSTVSAPSPRWYTLVTDQSDAGRTWIWPVSPPMSASLGC
eukprot:1891290-Pyramimonas_sp.AAC.1